MGGGCTEFVGWISCQTWVCLVGHLLCFPDAKSTKYAETMGNVVYFSWSPLGQIKVIKIAFDPTELWVQPDLTYLDSTEDMRSTRHQCWKLQPGRGWIHCDTVWLHVLRWLMYKILQPLAKWLNSVPALFYRPLHFYNVAPPTKWCPLDS